MKRGRLHDDAGVLLNLGFDVLVSISCLFVAELIVQNGVALEGFGVLTSFGSA